MKIIFAGTPEFARVALAALHAASFDIRLVLTQPDRPAGRGMKLQASPVKLFAQEKSIPVAQPRSLRLDGKFPSDAATARAAIEAAGADAMVVAAYGLILPQWVLGTPRLGCLNIHASLLPRWRGAAPIHRALEAGDTHTGITIMQMDAGLDTGDMLLVESMTIAPTDTTTSLHDKLAGLGGRLVVEALELAACGGLQPTKQPEQGITYAHKIDKHEAAIDWRSSAQQIERRIRAFDPFPGATAQLGAESLKIWHAQVQDADGSALPAGQILQVVPGGITVQCGQGSLCLTQLQRAGGKRMAAGELLRGFAITPGQRFAQNGAEH